MSGITEIRCTCKDCQILRLEREIARLREALEVYADKENWAYGDCGDASGLIVFYRKTLEGWEFAEKALEELK